MSGISSYLMSITAAALLCAIIKNIVSDKGTIGKMVKLLSGVFLAVTVISGWNAPGDLSFHQWIDSFRADAAQISQQGTQLAQQEMKSYVKNKTEEYILAKAAYLELCLEIEVTVSDDSLPKPVAVRLKGAASPYAKEALRTYIITQLDIPEEALDWT